MRWRELLDELVDRLGATEAGFALESVTGRKPTQLIVSLDDRADPVAVERVRVIADRVGAGEPLQHVLGLWGFRTLDLRIDGRALIPRPETEIVVEHALRALGRAEVATPDPLALDLGTGSGAIACALVTEHPTVVVVAVDSSSEALSLASENRASLGPERGRLHLLGTKWYAGLGPGIDGKVALIVSNPPYLSEGEWEAAPPVVRDWDPYGALVGGPLGTEAIEAVIAGAPRMLAPGGSLILEIGASQREAVVELGRGHGAASVAVERDFADRDRVAVMQW